MFIVNQWQKFGCVCAAGVLFVVSNVHGAVVPFFDKSAFLSATSSVDATGAYPNLGLAPDDTYTQGGITFTLTPPSFHLFIGGGPLPDGQWTTLLPGYEIASSEEENINIDVDHLVYALGIDFVNQDPEYEGSPNRDEPSAFDVTLKNNGTTVGHFSFNTTDIPLNEAILVGIWSDIPFNRVEFDESSIASGDEYFGHVYIGSTPLPEPAGFGFAAFVFGMVTRRRRQKCAVTT